jgi:hypothetical protein
MAAIKLVLKLDREAESVERAAARAFEESQGVMIEWTDENEKLYQEYMTDRKNRGAIDVGRSLQEPTGVR